MKTTRINSAARFTGLIIALALFAGVASAARGQEVGSAKGGATKLLFSVTPRSEPSYYKAMSCAKCNDKVVRVRDTDTKGGARALLTGAPPTKSVSRHGCDGCGNEWIVSGHGKAKTSVASHKCTSCGAENLACCNTSKSDAIATKGMEKKLELAPLK